MVDNPQVNSSTWTIPLSQPSESHPDLVEVSSRSTYLKKVQNSKSPEPKRLFVIIILLAFVTAVLLVAIGILSYQFDKARRDNPDALVCTSTQCVETAANLLESLDLETDPCQDFYQFTCGKWAGNHPIPDFTSSTDWFYERKLRLAQRIRKVLEKKRDDFDPFPVLQARVLYQSCLNISSIDAAGLDPIFQILEHAALPRKLQANITSPFSSSYSFPSLTNGNISYSKPVQSDLSSKNRWLVSLVGCKRILVKDPLIGFSIFPHPLNRTNNVVTIGVPSMRSPLPDNDLVNQNPNGRRRNGWRWQEMPSWAGRRGVNRFRDKSPRKRRRRDDSRNEVSVARTMYMESMVKLIDLYEAFKNVTIDPTVIVDFVVNHSPETYSNGTEKKNELRNYIRKIDELQEAVYRLYLAGIEEEINIMSESSWGKTAPPPFQEMLMRDLQMLTDEAAHEENKDPEMLIDWKVFFELMFNGTNVTLDYEKDTIIVQNLNYLKNLAKLLATTSPSTVEGLLWWEIVYVVAPHGNSLMRHLHNAYIEKMTGGEIPRSRSMDCAAVTNEMLGMAVSWMLASEEYSINKTSDIEGTEVMNIVEDTRNNVEKMLMDIRTTFSDLVTELDWMDNETKQATLKKADAMRSYVGYPSWLMIHSELESYYDGLWVDENSYLQNLINIGQIGMYWSLIGLRTENDIESWATDPTDVNAFHTFQENAITIPAGILQFPFYGLGLDALNYGAIGSILGHELTHGFDNSGRNFDEKGNWRQWWTNKTIAEYVNRTSCFIDQYSSYKMVEANVTVNGKQTLGENIADNGGIQECVGAYQRYKERNKDLKDIRLPGLEQFSQDHLVFIAFGSLWCEHGTPTTMKWVIERDEHSPSKARVWGAVSNSKEFAQTFNCPVGSPMNPDKKCRIW